MFTMPLRKRALVSFAALAMLGSVFAIAAGTGPQAKTIPYRGHVELDGVPLNGAVNMTFTLFDDASIGASTLSWSETQSVAPVGGDFAVLLGTQTTLPDAAFVAAALYLQVSVDGTPLTGLQPILPVASAHRADRAERLTVQAIRDVDGVRSTYDHTPNRWLVEATYDPAFPAFNTAAGVSTLDHNLFLSYCGDLDGCTLRLVMANWAAAPFEQTHASTAPVHFHTDPTTGAWRITQFTNDDLEFEDINIEYAPTQGLDGDGGYGRVLRAWNCFFTDAVMSKGDGSAIDSAPGFQLHNYNANTAYSPICRLMIDD